MNQSLGQFLDESREFIITTPATPREWYNYLWNPRYVTFFSHTGQGEGFTQDAVGRRIMVLTSRSLFLRDSDSGRFWSLCALPIDAPRTGYRCLHGMGYSIIEQCADGIASSFRCFVPPQDPCEVWTLCLRNTTQQTRSLKLFAHTNTTLDGPYRPQGYYTGTGHFDPALNAVILHHRQRFGDAQEALVHLGLSLPATGHDCALGSYIGFGTDQHPDAVARGQCANHGADMEKCLCALETAFVLAPGQEITLHLIAGAATSIEAIRDLREKLSSNEAIESSLATVRQAVARQIGQTRIQADDPHLRSFFDPWLKRQITLGAQWARVRHNGYRDQMQDIAALANINPEDARHQLHRVLRFQYSTGYAPRTWMDGQILDKDFSDNHVWIAESVHRLVMETGDLALLEELVPFNDGSTASVYEHVKRALDYYWNDRGLFGLLRIRSGDWNDCMNQVGPAGEGVSIWLSMAYYLANAQFIEFARLTARDADADTAAQRNQEMRQLVDQHGWDGCWYCRAYDDHGQIIGSHKNAEGTLFLLPQAWAVLSGIAQEDKGLTAMQSADELLETQIGTLKVLNAYSHWQPNIGWMTLKTPGTQENGGVYLHASAFKLVADCMLKRHDKVAAALHKILPFDDSAWTKSCEPYVMCNSYYAIKNSYRWGQSGQSWGTGSAGWMYYALLNHVFGLKPELAGLRLDPCLPPEWKNPSVTRPFRGATYHIAFDQTAGYREIAQIQVNGQPHTSPLLPYTKATTFNIRVTMK